MFDLAKLGVGEWFPYQESVIDKETGRIEWLPSDPDTDEKVCFKQPDADVFRAIKEKYKGKKINNPVRNPETRAMEIVVTYEQTPAQEKAQSMEFWDHAIVDWTIKDQAGKIIPLTAENKYKLVTQMPVFLRFCNRCLELLSGSKAEDDRAAEKNL